MGSLEPPLAHIPLFAGLPPDEQVSLFSLMKYEQFEANQTIFWFGDRGDSLYIISQGSVAVSVPTDSGQEMALSKLFAGGFFGELGLLDGGPRTATVRAAEPTELFVLARDRFHDFLKAHPAAAVEILRVVGTRQRSNTLALRGVKNANVLFERGRTTLWQHMSDRIANVAASQWFTLFHVIWFGGWIAWNLLSKFGYMPEKLAWGSLPVRPADHDRES